MTRSTCAWLDAPGGQSKATWLMASAVQQRAAPAALWTSGKPPASPLMMRWLVSDGGSDGLASRLGRGLLPTHAK
eukprot:4259534-Alexandrium_andersonii.AAC.1